MSTKSFMTASRKEADRGDVKAQCALGQMYEWGWMNTPVDYAEAFKWYQKAADQGDRRAQFSLGSMYDKGFGVPVDYAEAVKWYQRAADQGEALAQARLGEMYEFGRGGVMVDHEEAYFWMKLASVQSGGKLRTNEELVAKDLTLGEIQAVQKRVREWKPIVPVK